MELGNFGMFAPEVKPDAVACAFARDYIQLMYSRVRMGASASMTRRWEHAFHMLLKQFTQQEVALVLEAIEDRLPKVNYTKPETLRAQFGPLLQRVRDRWPHYGVVLPELPQAGLWHRWAVGMMHRWPNDTVCMLAIEVALRYQLFIFRSRVGNFPVGWPTAAAWLEEMAKQWQGWKRCPDIDSGATYWTPGCKHDALLDSIVDPLLLKRIRRGNHNG